MLHPPRDPRSSGRARCRSAALPAALLALLYSTSLPAQVPFQRVQIEQNAGDVKLVADIDLDGTVDVLLGGSRSEGLNWYHYPTWAQTRIAVPNTEFTTDGAVGDVDGDGDQDVVVPDGSSGDNLLWFENPAHAPNGGRGNPFAPGEWQRHVIGAVGSWCKDVELADFDGDGRLDAAARERNALMVFFRDAQGSWSRVPLPAAALGNEGLARGDVDRDGGADLILQGAWLRNPRGQAARNAALWTEHRIDTGGLVDGTFKALVTDLDADGRTDVLFSSSERTADVVWFGHSGDAIRGTWTPHLVATSVERAHTLQAADFDDDGDLDVVVGQMHTAAQPEILLYLNVDGRARSWTSQVVDDVHGIHNGVVADIGADGDLEVIGSNWTGNPPLQFWENLTPQPRMRLSVGELRGGALFEYAATGATAAGATVWFCASLTGTSSPYPLPTLGTTLELRDPVLLGYAIAGANGVAHRSLAVPPGIAGIHLWLQAAATGRNSEVAERIAR